MSDNYCENCECVIGEDVWCCEKCFAKYDGDKFMTDEEVEIREENIKHLATIDQLQSDLAAATAIVEKLPRTKDGAPIVHGDLLFLPASNGVIEWRAYTTADQPHTSRGPCACEQCYSTRELAEAARDGGKE